jgi:hypothetical protein
MDATTRRSSVTAERVSELFREVWPDRKCYPDLAACSFVAVRLETVKRMGVKRPKSPPPLGKAVKPARAFLRQLPTARKKLVVFDIRQNRRIPDQPIDIETLQSEFQKIIELVDKMAAVERDVRALLDAPFPFADRRNAAHFIADTAQKAWRRAGETDAPRSDPPDRSSERSPENDPLCVFVRHALAEIGHEYSISYVSDMLRDRHHRPRSGKARRRS